MKTQFRPRRQWASWHPDRGALSAFVNLVETTWSEPSSFSLQLTRPERVDTAEDIEDARRLLDTEDAFASATAIDVTVIGTSGSLDSMTFWWQGTSAVLMVAGRDEFIADALRNRASDILEAGSVDPEEPIPLVPSQRIVERQTQLPLAGVRFAGTYQALHRLVTDLADQVRQVRGSLDYVYVVLTERGTTLTVRHLSELEQITGRDVHRLRHLTISLGSSVDGPSLSLYVSVGRIVRFLSGSVVGPDEAPVRALRAAANDLLRERGGIPRWMNSVMTGTAVVLDLIGLGLVFVDDLWPLGLAIAGSAVVLACHPFYLPPVELLGEDEATRWSRWSRYIVGLAVAWLVGSLAVPLLTR